jgi:hypothetical protein
MTNPKKIEERAEAIEKIVKILNILPDEDIGYCVTVAETLHTRAIVSQEQQSA